MDSASRVTSGRDWGSYENIHCQSIIHRGYGYFFYLGILILNLSTLYKYLTSVFTKLKILAV